MGETTLVNLSMKSFCNSTFPGPAQLSIACSTKSVRRPGVSAHMIDIRTERINCAWAQWGVLGPRIVRSTKIAGNVLSEQVAAIIPIKFVFR